jgi:hypothetical protein
MNQATINTSIVQPSKSSEIETSQVLFKISIQVIGIKKRCRKSERHFFQLGHMLYNDGQFDKSSINDKVRAFIETNMKQVNSLTRVSLDHTIVTQDKFCTLTTWQPFSDKDVRFDLNIVL